MLGVSDNWGGALILLWSAVAFLVPHITGSNTMFGMMVLINTAVPKEMFVDILFVVLYFLRTTELTAQHLYEQAQWSAEPILAIEDIYSYTKNSGAPETDPPTPSSHSRCSSCESLVVASTGYADVLIDNTGIEVHMADVGLAPWSEIVSAITADVATEAIIVWVDNTETAAAPTPAGPADPARVKTVLAAPEASAMVSSAAVSVPSVPQITTYLTADGLDMTLLTREAENNAGAFGDIVFVSLKGTNEQLAFKTCKDTPGGRRQMEREVEVLMKVRHSKLAHIVEVLEIRVEPEPMLLMRREPDTFSSKLVNASNSNPREVATVVCGVLSAVGELSSMFDYLHRDLKPDNILVDAHGNAKLTDFGMCVKIEEARLAQNIGDGTPAYSAPETSTPTGASVLSEIYATGVIFIEGIINNCPFGEEELLRAARDRREDLEAQKEDLSDGIEIEQEEEEEEERENGEESDNGEEMSREETLSNELELVRIKEHRLGVANDDGWAPNSAAERKLAEMGKPLTFFVAQTDENNRTKDQRGNMARQEAQGNPSKLFEDNWVEWLTTYSRAECDEGLRLAVGVVLDGGMLDPDPTLRPQTVEAAQEVVLQALAVYEAAETAEKCQDG